jgi:hypothetical protein
VVDSLLKKKQKSTTFILCSFGIPGPRLICLNSEPNLKKVQLQPTQKFIGGHNDNKSPHSFLGNHCPMIGQKTFESFQTITLVGLCVADNINGSSLLTNVAKYVPWIESVAFTMNSRYSGFDFF